MGSGAKVDLLRHHGRMAARRRGGIQLVNHINWEEPLPSGPKEWFPIFRPPAGGRVEGWILSERPVSVKTHWYDEGEWACTAKIGRCLGCERVKNERWTAYLAAIVPARRVSVGILPITLNAAVHCRDLLLGGESLRGFHCLVRRVGTRRNGACYAEIGPKRIATDKIPPTFDLRAALVRLWGFPSDWIPPAENSGEIPY